MIETITKYRAKDGSEWQTLDKAMEREALCFTVDDAMAPLGPAIRITNHNYFQHQPPTVIACRAAILKLAAKQFPDYDVFRHEPPQEVHPMSIAGRILDDCGGPIDTAWRRFMRIDELGREWEQPYYARNTPPDANPFALEAKE
jgi:hypothetical protein